MREELAKRLWQVRHPSWILPDRGLDEAGEPGWFALADEVVRQMEWARQMKAYRTDARGSRYFTVDATSPLTPAPDEWKP